MIIALLLFSAFFVLPILKEAIKKKIGEKERTNAPGNFVSLSRGVVHYRWFGAETGDLVVCIHGLTTPSFVFEGLASHYANIGKRVLVLFGPWLDLLDLENGSGLKFCLG